LETGSVRLSWSPNLGRVLMREKEKKRRLSRGKERHP
jgi:hypothetical protein